MGEAVYCYISELLVVGFVDECFRLPPEILPILERDEHGTNWKKLHFPSQVTGEGKLGLFLRQIYPASYRPIRLRTLCFGNVLFIAAQLTSILYMLRLYMLWVVTGANKGIGFGIVKNLCQQFDGIVYLTARDAGRGMEAVEELNKLGLKPEFHQLDIDDALSITNFTNFIYKTYGGIDVLVNNAAIAYKHDASEPFGEQAEVTLRVNFFDLINVCSALFPLLRPHARVVNLSSSLGFLQRVPGEDLRNKLADPELTLSELISLMKNFVSEAKAGTHSNAGWPNSAYCVSKVGVSALTRIQHRQFLKDSRADIVINHVHPGYVDTDMTSHKGPLTIEQGADAPTYLALLPEGTTSPKGDYVWCTRQVVDWVNGPTPSEF